MECAAAADVRKTDLRPETELLLCCARTRLGPHVSERLRSLLRRGIDWNALFHSAYCHGLLPLVYRSLTATCPDAVPQAVLEQFKGHYRTTAWRNLFLTDQLVQILRRLEAHGILAIPLKGPVLAAALYGDLTLRDFIDLDILIPPQEIGRARDLLVAEGYRPESHLTGSQAAACFQSPKEHHFVLTGKDGRVLVELHWRLTQACYAFPLDADRWWRHLVKVPLADTTVPGFPAEELLLILCMHGAKHAWNQLKLICDVAELVRSHPGLDWGRLRRLARKVGCARMVNLGLVLAHQFLGTVLPEEAQDGLQTDPMVQTLSREVYQRFLRQDPDGSDPEDKWLFYLKVRERLRDRVQVCRGLGEIPAGTDRAVFPLRARFYFYLTVAVFPNLRDREVVALPVVFSLVYLLIRPLRLLGKYTRRMGKSCLTFFRLQR
jgi:hypothetical protein